MATVLSKFQRTPALRSRPWTRPSVTFSTRWRRSSPSGVAATPHKAGFSWTTERRVAERFPFLLRYRRHGEGPPLLLQGEVARDDVLFVKLDRNEHEVVALPKRVRVVSESVIERDPMEVRA